MGKARTFSNEGEESNYLKESEDEIYSSTQQNSYNLGSTTFSDQSGIGNFAQSGTDQRKANLTGALFRGNIGFLLQSAVLDETTSTINLLEDQNSVPVSDVSTDRIVIISGVATTADLELILGAQRPGQRFTLYNTDGNTITVKDATSTGSPTDPNLIRTPGGVDFDISGFGTATFIYDFIEEQWRVLGGIGGGGGTAETYISAELSGDQLTVLTTEHIEFDTIVEDGGIVLQTGAGQANGIFELKANKTYYLSAYLAMELTGAGSNAAFEWYDITNTVAISNQTNNLAMTNATTDTANAAIQTIFKPSVDVNVVVRLDPIVSSGTVPTVYAANTQASIFEIVSSGGSGGDGYNLIQDEGINVTQRQTMNFIGASVTAVDNPGQSRTDITITPGANTVPVGTAENQHLEWDDTNTEWDAVNFLEMGSTGPFASDGLIRYANNEIMLSSRNSGDTGDIEIKVTSSNKFIFDFDGAVPLEISSDLIDVKTVDIVNIDRAKFVTNSGSMVPSDTTGILRNSNSQFQFNTADTSDFTFTFDNNDPSFVIDRDTSDNDNTLVSLLSNETDINSASFLNIVKNFPIPVSLQEIGHLNFIAGNSAGSALFEYASIIGKIEDNSSGSIYGSMIFNATVNDSITPFVILNNASNGIIEALRDVTLVNTTSNPVLTLFRDQIGADEQTISNILFKGQTASGGDFVYSSITSVITDETLGQEKSEMVLATTQDGLFGTNLLTINADADRTLRYESGFDASTLTPQFEIRTFYTISPPTGVIDIGQLNFSTNTNDSSTIGPQEIFASIIGAQEDPDIDNESGSLRFRVRDQTGTAGALKTYLQFNDTSNGIIEALKDITLENFSLNPVLAFFRNETGVTDNPLGNIVFKGRQSNDNPFTYSTISSAISDATLGQEDSIITLSTTNDGIFGNVKLIVNADSSQILRFASNSPSIIFNSPIFEFYSTTDIAPTTGTIQRIGAMNFEATTNNGGGVGDVETFAQIIVDQEESDIDNESGSLRFRVRDQTGTAGALKTYLQFNDTSNGVIEALKNLDMSSNEITNVQNIFTNDDSPNNQIGDSVVGANPGGFNYFVDERITWEGDFDTYIEFGIGGISVVSDDNIALVANDALSLFSDETVTWVINSSAGLNMFINGATRATIQDNALVLTADVDLTMQDGGNILMGVGYFEIEDFGGNPGLPDPDNGRMFAKVDAESVALEPFWIDDAGTVTSMLAGGGSGGATLGLSVVKTADESRVSTTTLSIDSEFLFTPEANKIYYIEFNLKYTTSFTQLKTGIQCGADARYQIVDENFDVFLETWSDPSASNIQTITHSNVQGDFKSTVFYVIVQVNSDTDDVGLSWAQNSNNPSPTTISKGSLMRVFGEGINGGGGGRVSTDFTLSTTVSPEGSDTGFLDTGGFFVKNDNGFDNIGLTLLTSATGSPIYTYTIQASDLPVGFTGVTVEQYGATIGGSCENSGGTTTVFVRGYLNGVAVDDITRNDVIDAGFAAVNSTKGIGVEVGDVIGFDAWTNGGTQVVLEKAAVWVSVSEFKVTAQFFSQFYPTDEESDTFLSGDFPQNITISRLRPTYFPIQNYNGKRPGTLDTEWGVDIFLSGFGNTVESLGFDQNQVINSSTEQLNPPFYAYIRTLRIVE